MSYLTRLRSTSSVSVIVNGQLVHASTTSYPSHTITTRGVVSGLTPEGNAVVQHTKSRKTKAKAKKKPHAHPAAPYPGLSEDKYNELKEKYPDIDSVSCPICVSEPNGGPIYHCPRTPQHFLCAQCFSGILFNEKCPMCREPMPKTAPLRYLDLEAYIRRAFEPSFKCRLYDSCKNSFYTQIELERHETDDCGWSCPIKLLGMAYTEFKCTSSATGCNYETHALAHFASDANTFQIDRPQRHNQVRMSIISDKWMRSAFCIELDPTLAESTLSPSVMCPVKLIVVAFRRADYLIVTAFSTSQNANRLCIDVSLERIAEPRGSVLLVRAPVNPAAPKTQISSKLLDISRMRRMCRIASTPIETLGLVRHSSLRGPLAFALGFTVTPTTNLENEDRAIVIS